MSRKKTFTQLTEWSKSFSDLPWRKRRSLYHTLVSEIMLQQTTVPTVLNHFDRFVKIYPDIKTLSKTNEETIQVNWKGLGYYRRARNLLKAAKYIQSEFKGEIPLDFDTLVTIPGIGDYTANALRAIGNNEYAICVDANLERVLSRYYLIDAAKGTPLKKELKRGFDSEEYLGEMKKLGGRAINEALMDLGREICLPKNPRCKSCPLSPKCKALESSTVEKYPVVTEKAIKRKAESYKLTLLRVLIKKGDEVLVYKKRKGRWLEGQMELPTFIIKSEDKTLTQYPKLVSKLRKEPSKIYKTLITKYKIENHVIEMTEARWRSFSEREGLNQNSYFFNKTGRDQNLSTATFKAIK